LLRRPKHFLLPSEIAWFYRLMEISLNVLNTKMHCTVLLVFELLKHIDFHYKGIHIFEGAWNRLYGIRNEYNKCIRSIQFTKNYSIKSTQSNYFCKICPILLIVKNYENLGLGHIGEYFLICPSAPLVWHLSGTSQYTKRYLLFYPPPFCFYWNSY